MRNVLTHVPSKQKQNFVAKLKQIWLQPDYQSPKKYVNDFMNEYKAGYPEAMKTLTKDLEYSLQYYSFDKVDLRKIASTNMIESLNREIRRKTSVVGTFPSFDFYVRFVTSYLIE